MVFGESEININEAMETSNTCEDNDSSHPMICHKTTHQSLYTYAHPLTKYKILRFMQNIHLTLKTNSIHFITMREVLEKWVYLNA